MRLQYIAMFSFVFIASFAISQSSLKNTPTIVRTLAPREVVTRSYPPIPILKNDALAPEVSATSVFAIDVDSGVTLYEKSADDRLFPASTTKMLTALTALDYYDLDRVITIDSVKVDGQKMGLKEGEQITVRDLLSGLLIWSANDAAEVLAANYCKTDIVMGVEECGRDTFIKAMNDKAQELHLDNTNFINPSGLDSEGHLTTARDLSRIAIEGMKNKFFSDTVGTKETVVASQNSDVKHRLVNLNELLGEVSGVLGVKTGWTENAKENLVTYIKRDSRKVVIVILGSEDRFGDTKQIIDFVFDNYEWKSVRI